MQKYQRNESWLLKTIDDYGNFTLVPLVAKEEDLRAVIRLNETAAAIWMALEAPLTEVELRERLSLSFDTEAAESWHADLRGCLDNYLECSAIRVLYC